MYDVLIVDDDRTTRYMLKRFKKWESFGFNIFDEAGDGNEALRKLSNHHCDLLLTDIKMPGMDGIELLKELNILQWDICVVFLSTHSDFNYAKQGIRWGVFDYMTKPIEEQILAETLSRVKEHLDEKATNRLGAESSAMKQLYPGSYVKTLTALLLAGSPSVTQEAHKILAEMDLARGADPTHAARLVQNIMAEVKQGIYSVFPWLEKIENDELGNLAEAGANIDEITDRFLDFCHRMQAVIKKYELNQTDGIVKRTCIYVIDHVEASITLDMVANEINVSKDYIGKLFKQKTGYNFHDYVTRIKMEHAKYLIRTGEYKNYEISEKLGYKTVDYFSQLFKEYSGCTPRMFKKLNQ